MVKGLSFQKGIIFIGTKHIACAYHVDSRIKTWIKPASPQNLMYVGWMVFAAMPAWYHLLLFAWIFLIVLPYGMNAVGSDWEFGLPSYTLIYFFLGTHFWFPKELKKYHGAEHKVFSFREVISVRNQNKIVKATITNRYCSTNSVMLFFLLVPIVSACFYLAMDWSSAWKWGTITTLLLWPPSTYWLNRTKETTIHTYLLALSYWLQRQVTTLPPDTKHVKTAIMAYRKLALKEFPQKVRPRIKRKNNKRLAIVNVTIILSQSESVHASLVKAKVQKVLEETPYCVLYECSPVGMTIKGEVADLLKLLEDIQKVPLSLGCPEAVINMQFESREGSNSSTK